MYQNSSVITVEFFVTCHTNIGEQVYLCGNTSELGNWCPKKGFKLETGKRRYPKWGSVQPLLVRQNEWIQFKICILNGDLVTWQSFPQNRKMFTCQRPLQVYLNFNNRFMEVFEKNVFEIDCRKGTTNVLKDIDSQWGSSIGHSSNYPILKYHKLKKDCASPKLSPPSSNLISLVDSEQFDFEQHVTNLFTSSMIVGCRSKGGLQKKLSSIKQLATPYQQTIISEKDETNSTTSRRKSHRSLSKDYSQRIQELLRAYKIPKRNSAPISRQQNFNNNEVKALVSQTRGKQAKRNSEKETLKSSWLSESSAEQNSVQGQKQHGEIFGLEFF